MNVIGETNLHNHNWSRLVNDNDRFALKKCVFSDHGEHFTQKLMSVINFVVFFHSLCSFAFEV